MTELQLLLEEINQHNKMVYDSYKPNEKIDFSKFKKSWGTDVIPKKFWLDPTKTYTTKNGCKVTNLQLVLKNSSGKEVTFPFKGTLHIPREGKKDRISYEIWTLDGRCSINEDSPYNIDLSLL